MVVDDVSRRIVGQLIPPGAYAVRLTVGDRVIEELTDGLGRFTFEPVSRDQCGSRSRISTVGTSPRPSGCSYSARWLAQPALHQR